MNATRRPFAATALLLALAAPAAQAHDTWFERLDGAPAPRLALGTGNRFPQQESAIDPRFISAADCRAARLATALVPLATTERALELQATPGAATCWLQTAPFELTLAPDKIALYLAEAQASPAVRAQWAELQRRGLPWRERYVKYARIELGTAPQAAPTPLGLELVIEHEGPVEAGQAFAVRVRRDGQPLPGQAVELRSEDSPLGLWRRSGDDGRMSFPAPAAGRWLLRAIELRPSASRPDTWDSRFATTAFEIGPQNGSSFSSNARSTNQAAATAAMSSEPAASTARR